MNRSLIFESRDHAEAYGEITRLNDDYRRAFKRTLPIDMLVFAAWGAPRNEHYGITLVVNGPLQEDAATWLRNNVLESVAV